MRDQLVLRHFPPVSTASAPYRITGVVYYETVGTRAYSCVDCCVYGSIEPVLGEAARPCLKGRLHRR